MARYTAGRISAGATRFTDGVQTNRINAITIDENMTPDQKAYLSSQKAFTSATKTIQVDASANTLLWGATTIATPPTGFPALGKTDFQIFINGSLVEVDAIDSIVQNGSSVLVTFNNTLGFSLGNTDEYTIIGKFTS